MARRGFSLRAPAPKALPKPKKLDARRFANHKQRLYVLKRDHYTCRYCGSAVTIETANIDHVVPWRDGGRTTGKNLVAACPPCNKEKLNYSVNLFLKLREARVINEELDARLDSIL